MCPLTHHMGCPYVTDFRLINNTADKDGLASWRLTAQIKVWAGLVPSEGLLGIFSPCVHKAITVCLCAEFPLVRTPVLSMKAHPIDLILPQSPL